MKAFVFPSLVLYAALAAGAQENYSTWGQHRNVYLNTASNGAVVQTNTVKFPVLVRLGTADSAVFSQSLAGGADLRFTKADDATRLPHQIESWNASTKTAAVWVLVDTVYGANNQQLFRMHWAKTAVADSSRGSAVFQVASGFEGVWHFSDGVDDTAYDATANGFHGIGMRSSEANYSFPERTDGMIGRARLFGTGPNASTTSASAGNYFTVPNTATGRLNFPENGTYSLSVWVNVSLLGDSRSMISKGDLQYTLELRDAGTTWDFSEYKDGAGWEQVVTPATELQWAHLIAVRAGIDMTLYMNGAKVSDITYDGTNITSRNTTLDFTMGRNPSGTNRFFRGMIDEVRVASVARTAGWARLEYENQKPAQTLVSFTQPVAIHGVASHAPQGASLAAKALSGGLSFRVLGLGAAETQGARLSLTDMSGRAVWSGAFAPGADHLLWNGTDRHGNAAASGVYTARVTLKDANGATRTVLDARVPYTR